MKKKLTINMSMTNGSANGVEIYSLKLKSQLDRYHFALKYLYLPKNKFLSAYRLFWNTFLLPFKAKGNLVYSLSTHGSPFYSNQIITIHDLICFDFPKQHKFQYYYFKFFVPYIIKSSKKVIAISNFTKSEILKHYKIPENKIEVIYNGANKIHYEENEKTEKEFQRITEGKDFFISVGASYSHKNIERLLDAIAKLNLDVKYIILSKKNHYGDLLREKSKSLGLKNVVFIDFAEDNLLAKLYIETVCNIYISLYEGFGFPPLEAASVGTTSLVGDIPVMREVLGDEAYYVDPKDTNLISEKISEIYKEFKEGKLHKKDFSSLLSKFSWEETCEKVVNLIKNYI